METVWVSLAFKVTWPKFRASAGPDAASAKATARSKGLYPLTKVRAFPFVVRRLSPMWGRRHPTSSAAILALIVPDRLSLRPRRNPISLKKA